MINIRCIMFLNSHEQIESLTCRMNQSRNTGNWRQSQPLARSHHPTLCICTVTCGSSTRCESHGSGFIVGDTMIFIAAVINSSSTMSTLCGWKMGGQAWGVCEGSIATCVVHWLMVSADDNWTVATEESFCRI